MMCFNYASLFYVFCAYMLIVLSNCYHRNHVTKWQVSDVSLTPLCVWSVPVFTWSHLLQYHSVKSYCVIYLIHPDSVFFCFVFFFSFNRKPRTNYKSLQQNFHSQKQPVWFELNHWISEAVLVHQAYFLVYTIIK